MFYTCKKGRLQEDMGRLRGLDLKVGEIIGACDAVENINWEYTVKIEENRIECFEEKFIADLELAEIPWVSKDSRKVAVCVETHGDHRFLAEIIHRSSKQLFEVRFIADGSVLRDVELANLSEPNDFTINDASPQSMQPDPLWILDRKIQANIDERWPMQQRIAEALKLLQKPRLATKPPVTGPFTGKDAFDSEDYPGHPKPPIELHMGIHFRETWSRFAGRIRFANTYKIGPAFPQEESWVDKVDAGEPLYFSAALPVHAGLICLGRFPPVDGQPEWIRASDVALLGIALYVDGELHPSFDNPPLERINKVRYRHESCRFIPGCASTYSIDSKWVGGVFCLAPNVDDWEVRDDLYNILAYHEILREGAKQPFRHTNYDYNVLRLEVNLVLSTSYLATVRQVCAGSVRVVLSPEGISEAQERLRGVLEGRVDSKAALNPKRQTKVLSRTEDVPSLREARELLAQAAAERAAAERAAEHAAAEPVMPALPALPAMPSLETPAVPTRTLNQLVAPGPGLAQPPRPALPPGPRLGPFSATGTLRP